MGNLTRQYNWQESAIGSPDSWPQSLRTTVNIMLNSKFPMLLFWGPEMICFYNDAYRPSLGQNGKHPGILGKPAAEAFEEIWSVIKPLLYQVFEGGEAVWQEDQLIPIFRNGHVEDVYWTFSYCPVADDASENPAGVLVICNETTDKILAYQKLEEKNLQLQTAIEAVSLAQQEIKENVRNLRQIILQAPVAMALFEGNDYIVEIANERALTLWGKKLEDVLEKPILGCMPELISQGFKELLDHVYKTGETFSATELPVKIVRYDQVETAYVNFVFQALADPDGKINRLITIGTDVTAQVINRKKLENSEAKLQSLNEELAVSVEELTASNEELERMQLHLREIIGRLSESEEKLKFAIATGEMGIWTWNADPRNSKASVSPFVNELFGFLPGQHPSPQEFKQLIHPDYLPKVDEKLKEAIEQKQFIDLEYPIRNLQNNKLKWIRATGKMFYDDHGVPTLYYGLVMDITERKLDELRKNDFIAMVSHELKTPLTSLTLLIQLMDKRLKNSGDSFTTTSFRKSSALVKKMNGMINGFLNVSRLESGKLQMHKESFDLGGLINEVVEEFLFATNHSNNTINITAAEKIIIDADREKIASVLSNLINNAIKYSAADQPIHINCTTVGNSAQVSITDKGIGIKAHDLEKLFNRYYRIENQHTRNIAGFGIGLYLCAEIINRHNGKIWAESEPDKGSTFYFSLPL